MAMRADLDALAKRVEKKEQKIEQQEQRIKQQEDALFHVAIGLLNVVEDLELATRTAIRTEDPSEVIQDVARRRVAREQVQTTLAEMKAVLRG